MAKYKSSLNADTVSPLNVPPVRLGLQTKLNLLAIGLIVATAIGICAFLVRQQVTAEQTRLQARYDCVLAGQEIARAAGRPPSANP